VKILLLVMLGAFLCESGHIYGDAILRHALFRAGYVHEPGIMIDKAAPNEN